MNDSLSRMCILQSPPSLLPLEYDTWPPPVSLFLRARVFCGTSPLGLRLAQTSCKGVSANQMSECPVLNFRGKTPQEFLVCPTSHQNTLAKLGIAFSYQLSKEPQLLASRARPGKCFGFFGSVSFFALFSSNFASNPFASIHHVKTIIAAHTPHYFIAPCAIMASQADLDAGHYSDLFDSIDSFDYRDPDQPSLRESLSGRVFLLTTDQFLELQEKLYDFPPNLLPGYEYEDGVLCFKDSMSHVHNQLCGLMTTELITQMLTFRIKRPDSDGIPPFRVGYGLQQEFGVNPGDRRRWRTPDTTILGPKGPIIVVEVSYAHRFSRQKLQDRYQSYFSDFPDVKMVFCLDIYYGRGPGRAAKTAQYLDRSAISIWAFKDGQIQNVMDWVPLS